MFRRLLLLLLRVRVQLLAPKPGEFIVLTAPKAATPEEYERAMDTARALRAVLDPEIGIIIMREDVEISVRGPEVVTLAGLEPAVPFQPEQTIAGALRITGSDGAELTRVTPAAGWPSC